MFPRDHIPELPTPVAVNFASLLVVPDMLSKIVGYPVIFDHAILPASIAFVTWPHAGVDPVVDSNTVLAAVMDPTIPGDALLTAAMLRVPEPATMPVVDSGSEIVAELI